jgi:hypothetical protein
VPRPSFFFHFSRLFGVGRFLILRRWGQLDIDGLCVILLGVP